MGPQHPGTGASGGQGAADSGGVSTDKPANRDTLNTSKKQQDQVQHGTTAPSGGAKMQEKNTNMPTQAGPNETGTAKDTAGTATQRDPAKQKEPAKQ